MNPMPLPVEIKLGRDNGPEGEEVIVFKVVNFHGEFVFFIDPETAFELGKSLSEVGKEKNSGLIVAPAGLIV